MTKKLYKERMKEWVHPLNDEVHGLNASPDSFDFIKNLNESDLPLCHFCFRKVFSTENLPEKLVVHVAARNMYKLHVNGQF